MLALGAALLIAPAPIAGAAAGGGVPDEAAPAAPEVAGVVPSAAGALWAYRASRRWMEAWSTEASTDAWPAQAGVGPAGVSVQLREGGLLLGRSSVLGLNVTSGDGGGPARELVRRAVAGAIADATARQPTLPARMAALRREGGGQSGGAVLVSVELAGAPTPIVPEEPADLDAMLAAGLEGLAVRVRSGGSERVECVFPSAMLCAGQTPSQAAQGLLSQVTGRAELALERPRVLRDKHGVEFFKFAVTHVADYSGEASGAPAFMVRGQRLVSAREVESAGRLRAWADELAAGLLRRVGADGSMAALVRPWSAAGPVGQADAPERLVAALALAEYAAAGGATPAARTAWLARAEVAGARAAAVGVIMATPLPPAPPGGESLAAATAALAHQACTVLLRTSGGRPAGETAELARRAEAALAVVRASTKAGEVSKGALPLAARALLVRSLVMAGDATGPEALRAVAGAVEPQAMVSLMPWLAWAALEGGDADAPVPQTVALREMRSLVWSHQIGARQSATLGPDTEGGIAFTAGGSVLPTWHTARPVGALAAMLADPRITGPGERAAEIGRVLSALRFLRQLTADETIGWMAVDGQAVRGGVRAAPWDVGQPVDAAAMTLLAVLRATAALETMAAAGPAKAP